MGIELFTGAYSLARRSGWLNTTIGQRVFLSAYFAYKKHIEDPFHRLIRKHPELFRGGDILDIGANVGYCSVLFAGAADPGARVYAFEPEPGNFRMLEGVIRNHGGRIVPVQAAIGAAEGAVELWLNDSHHADHRVVTNEFQPEGKRVRVPLLTVDGYLGERGIAAPVCLIKIDVQGYELAVCQGMERTLEANPLCSVVLEYMPAAVQALGFEPTEILRWFSGRGYGVQTLDHGGALHPGVRDPGARGYCDLLFSRARAAKATQE